MYDVLFMHVFHAFANLSHVVDDFGFAHVVAVVCDFLEKLSARHAETNQS